MSPKTDEPSGSPLRKVLFGLSASATSAILQMIAQIITISTLSRLLTPAEFGVVAPLVALMNILAIVVEGGFGAALINHRGDVRNAYANALGVTLFMALAVACLIVTLAPFVPGASRSDDAVPMLRLLSLLVFLQPLSTLAESIFLKSMSFQRVVALELASVILGATIVPILLAWAGFGAWSLAVAPIARYGTKVLLYLHYAPAPPKPRFDRKVVRELVSFSGYYTVAKVASIASLQGDRIVLANFLTPAAVGVYTRAQNVIQLSLDITTASLDRILFPLFAATGGDLPTTRTRYINIVAALSAVTSAASVAVIFSAPLLVRVVLGPAWTNAILIVQLLAPLVLLRSIDRTSAALLRSGGWVRWRAVTQTGVAIAVLGSAALLWPLGIHAVALAVLTVAVLNFVVTQIAVSMFLQTNMTEIIRMFRSALVTSTITATAFIIAERTASGDLGAPAVLIASTAAGILITGTILMFPRQVFGTIAGNYFASLWLSGFTKLRARILR